MADTIEDIPIPDELRPVPVKAEDDIELIRPKPEDIEYTNEQWQDAEEARIYVEKRIVRASNKLNDASEIILQEPDSETLEQKVDRLEQTIKNLVEYAEYSENMKLAD